MLTQYEKLKAILREMFQMDQADLDFGIYRIMNARRDEIEKFLDSELLPQVDVEFAKYRGTEIEGKKKELAQLVATIHDSGMNPDDSPKVQGIREELAKYGDDETLANEVFSHLTSFFRRYYDDGDFLSLRRYKKDTYAIPYEGEEVKLHWANADQYYIKTSEYLKDYVFKLVNGKKAHFKLVDASQEKDNIKTEAGKERKFKLYDDEPIRISANDVFIQFVYLPDKEKQDAINKKTMEFINGESGKKLQDFYELFASAPTAKNPQRTLWEKHLYSYTARFNFDFFIHKDLGGFLRRELDFYIKNEVLFVDDLDAQDEQNLKTAVTKVKVIKHIALKIIAFLAQLEDFQKKLWLKKKFVVSCGYCVTLDRVPEALYPDIIHSDAQRDEWVKLFAIDEIDADLAKPGYSQPLTIEFLKANPYLVLDTKHFDEQFKDKMLASFDNLDEATDGVIINSENFQALNLLQEKYCGQVSCIYIDPPYNTSDNAFIYKNEYKHSSWLAMVAGGVSLSKEYLNSAGVIIGAIDDTEYSNFKFVLINVFGSHNYIGTVAVEVNPAGQNIRPNVPARSHDYFHVFANNIDKTELFLRDLSEEELEQYDETDDKGDFYWDNLRRRGGNSRPSDRPKQWFPLFLNTEKNIVRVPEMDWEESTRKWIINEKPTSCEIEVWPIHPKGEKRIWRVNRDGAIREITKGNIAVIEKAGRLEISKKSRVPEGKKPKTLWSDSKYSATSNGSKLLIDIMGSGVHFSYPKSIYLTTDAIRYWSDENAYICDYFGGSGTTGHATINLNREDDGKRKYILVEMGNHFETILKPRIQKVVYSKDWKDGKPVSREGSSHMFKYLRLESYDDTLDNLQLLRTEGQQVTLDGMDRRAREDYMRGYLLNVETRASDSLLNIDRFIDPFSYTLKIRRDNELKDEKIDLVETFNYLIGLYVEQTETIRGFKVVRGKLRTGEKTLVIWRNTKEKTNEALDDFFKKQGYNTLDFEFDLIFVNGDNNLENLKVAEDKWKVRLIEEEFKKKMFAEGI